MSKCFLLYTQVLGSSPLSCFFLVLVWVLLWLFLFSFLFREWNVVIPPRGFGSAVRVERPALYAQVRGSSPDFVLCTAVLHVPFSFVSSFRLVVFRLFLVSPSSLSFSLPCFPQGLVTDSVILLFRLGATPPPRAPWAPCEPDVCVFPLACCLLPCVVDVDLFLFFFSSFPFSILIWPSLVFILSFILWVLCCLLGFGFCCDCLAYDMYVS